MTYSGLDHIDIWMQDYFKYYTKITNYGLDHNDKQLWYYGSISREHATLFLTLTDQKDGVFLIRDSCTFPGDFVLSVKRNCKVYHRNIFRFSKEIFTTKLVGGREFPNLASFVEFYRLKGSITTYLVIPKTPLLKKYGLGTFYKYL